MYEYKVIKVYVNNAEAELNVLAKEGWRVVAVTPVIRGFGVIVTLERERPHDALSL